MKRERALELKPNRCRAQNLEGATALLTLLPAIVSIATLGPIGYDRGHNLGFASS